MPSHWFGLEWQPGPNGIPTTQPRPSLQPAADEDRALLHPDETPSASFSFVGGTGRTVVEDLDPELVRFVAEVHQSRRPPRVAEGIRERLLDDPIHRHIQAAR